MRQRNQRNQPNPKRDPRRDPDAREGMGDGPGGGRWRILLWLLLAAALVPWLWGQFTGDNGLEISYSNFRQQVEADNVEEVTIQDQRVQGTFVEPVERTVDGETVEQTDFITYVPAVGDDELLSLLDQHDVEVNAEPTSEVSWVSILISVLPFLLLIGLGYMFLSRMRNQGQGIFSMGKSGARLYDEGEEKTTFDDVAGVEGAKAELEEIIEFLRNPDRFQRLGGQMPKGVLLVGPPGTGKTLLARAVAGEAGVPFFSITGSDFMEMFVGVGASRVRDLFEEAKNRAPSVIFIDELDSIGRRRGTGVGGGHDEREQTLNQLLSELDGFEPSENVIVIAATNRPDILDPALLRPGRFDRRVTVDKPTMLNRLEILKIHARNKPLANDVDLKRVARGTPGFSGADLENMLNEAALLAARKDKNVIEDEDIEDARDKILMGLERENLDLTERELEVIAYHEGGHALVAAVLPNADPIHKVSIVPRGRAMGVTQQLPERDKYLYPREYMMDRMAVMMGGRAAEDLIFGSPTSGAENDLKQVTRLARKMVLDWGMSERLGHVALGGEEDEVFLGEDLTRRRHYSEATAREIDEEVRNLVEEAYNQALKTLRKYRDKLDLLANTLLEVEEIPGERVLELVGAQKEMDEGVGSSGIRTGEDGILTREHPEPADTPAD